MSIDCFCKGHENYYECPVNYLECKPSFHVPAVPLLVTFYDDQVIIEERENGVCVVGFDRDGQF